MLLQAQSKHALVPQPTRLLFEQRWSEAWEQSLVNTDTGLARWMACDAADKDELKLRMHAAETYGSSEGCEPDEMV